MSTHFKPSYANVVCHTKEERPTTTPIQSHVTCPDCLDEIKIVDDARRSQFCQGCGDPKSPGLVMCLYCYRGGNSPFKDWMGRFNEWVVSAAANRRGVS